jgi:hypothetical protein
MPHRAPPPALTQAASGDDEVMPGRPERGEKQPGEHTCHRGPLCDAPADDGHEHDDDGSGHGCAHSSCQQITCESGCAPCRLAEASDSGPAAGPCTITGPGPLTQVHTCPYDELSGGSAIARSGQDPEKVWRQDAPRRRSPSPTG